MSSVAFYNTVHEKKNKNKKRSKIESAIFVLYMYYLLPKVPSFRICLFSVLLCFLYLDSINFCFGLFPLQISLLSVLLCSLFSEYVCFRSISFERIRVLDSSVLLCFLFSEYVRFLFSEYVCVLFCYIPSFQNRPALSFVVLPLLRICQLSV